jgi:hypothetical protein
MMSRRAGTTALKALVQQRINAELINRDDFE